MKLLKKTSRTYLIISASAFFAAGIIIYFVISFFLDDQLKEKLMSDRMTVISMIKKDNSVPYYYPFIIVRKLSGGKEQSLQLSDTMIFDANENEDIPFRQISSSDVINGITYRITVRDTLLEKSDMLMTIAITMGLVFIFLMIALYFINKRLSGNIWRPFYRTLDDLRKFSYEDKFFRLSSATEIDEFAELNTTLKNLTSKVITDYQSLKRFTEDASHEIQTPLAVIQAKLETLIQFPDLSEEQSEIIKAAYTSVQRISRLTQALLLLTKISNDQFPEKRNVNLSELLEQKLKSFEDQISSKSLILNMIIDPDCIHETNLFLAESMIMNLVGNAVRHTNDGGTISIILSMDKFEISNSGTPFSVPSSVLFERFFKESTSKESLGLGLSIVKEICSLNKWKISHKYEDAMHKFTVIF